MKSWEKIENLGQSLNKKIKDSRDVIGSLDVNEEERYQYRMGYLDGEIDTTEGVVAELRPLWGTTKKDWERAEKKHKSEVDRLVKDIDGFVEDLRKKTEEYRNLEEKLNHIQTQRDELNKDMRRLKEKVDNDPTSVTDEEFIEAMEKEKKDAWDDARKYFSIEVEYLKRIMRENGLDPDNVDGSSHD